MSIVGHGILYGFYTMLIKQGFNGRPVSYCITPAPLDEETVGKWLIRTWLIRTCVSEYVDVSITKGKRTNCKQKQLVQSVLSAVG